MQVLDAFFEGKFLQIVTLKYLKDCLIVDKCPLLSRRDDLENILVHIRTKKSYPYFLRKHLFPWILLGFSDYTRYEQPDVRFRGRSQGEVFFHHGRAFHRGLQLATTLTLHQLKNSRHAWRTLQRGTS